MAMMRAGHGCLHPAACVHFSGHQQACSALLLSDSCCVTFRVVHRLSHAWLPAPHLLGDPCHMKHTLHSCTCCVSCPFYFQGSRCILRLAHGYLKGGDHGHSMAVEASLLILRDPLKKPWNSASHASLENLTPASNQSPLADGAPHEPPASETSSPSAASPHTNGAPCCPWDAQSLAWLGGLVHRRGTCKATELGASSARRGRQALQCWKAIAAASTPACSKGEFSRNKTSWCLSSAPVLLQVPSRSYQPAPGRPCLPWRAAPA